MTRTARRKVKKKHEEASTWGELSVKQVTRVSSSGKMFQRKKKKVKASEVEKVDEKRERMRQKRRQRRAYSKVCFKCRQPGHHLEDCKNNNDEMNICFKCGSTEHSVKSCKAIVPSGSYPFALCFICGESGHLSRSCPDNPRGLYPNGGGCKVCGSVEHFKANCPEKLSSSKLKEKGDLSLEDEEMKKQIEQNHKLKQKIVKF